MAERLPVWVIDLVIAIEKHEDEHAKDGSCLDHMLALVPADVRQQAETIHAYKVATDRVAP